MQAFRLIHACYFDIKCVKILAFNTAISNNVICININIQN